MNLRRMNSRPPFSKNLPLGRHGRPNSARVAGWRYEGLRVCEKLKTHEFHLLLDEVQRRSGIIRML
jgi:hypothetical protein